jgi:hypothetical protein
MLAFVELTRRCLAAHEYHSQFCSEGGFIQPDDARYTDLIGEWDGYKAPEQRWLLWQATRKALRRQILELLASGGSDRDKIEDESAKILTRLKEGSFNNG